MARRSTEAAGWNMEAKGGARKGWNRKVMAPEWTHEAGEVRSGTGEGGKKNRLV